MNTPHLWLVACMLFLASTSNTALSQSADATRAPVLVQLDFPLSQNSLTDIRSQGIHLHYHYGNGAYLASSAPAGFTVLQPHQLPKHRATILKQFENALPLYNTRIEVDLVLACENAASFLGQVLAKAEFEAFEKQIENGRTLTGSVPIGALEKLLAHPYILDATPSLTEVEPYNLEARIVQSVMPLNSGIAGAPSLNGRGVIIGVGDGGTLAGHPDIGERVLHTTSNYNPGWGNHPDMVSGIMIGAGNVFSTNRGVASEAELIVETNSAIVYSAPTYFQDYGMTITNNSYGPSFHCNTANRYFGNSASVDQQLFDNPSLLHVFAVGNSGRNSCGDFEVGYSTIPGGPQNAKNTLSVGNVDHNRKRYATSSAGPTQDGRLKPEISAVGTTITTTIRNGGYGTGTGTSFAAPNVASSLALLSEAYQRNTPENTPSGALLKAIACNTADDAGRPGPDFEYGFGILNAYNALQVVNAGQFELGSIEDGEEVEKVIRVAEHATELKVMLYWNDVAGSTTNESAVLVNDLELVLISADEKISYPLVLDPTNPTAAAVQGEDHVNNIEQVTIKNPKGGDYRVIIRPTTLSYAAIDFVLTWFAPQPKVVLTSPFGGESMVPSQSTNIAWTATTGDEGSWSIEYSVNGQQWNLIEEGIEGSERSIQWAPPSDISHAEFRITNESSRITDKTNAPVSIVSPPLNLSSIELCATSLQFSWSPTEGAARYAVYQFDGDQMQQVGLTTDTLWVFHDLQIDEQLILSVSAITEANHNSKRAYAYQVVHAGLEPACSIPAVVEWGELSTEELGAAVRVHWDVLQEQRIERFELERGLKYGANIEWTFVDTVRAKGTSTTTLSYTLRDAGAAAAGFTYYRIKMVGQDGQHTYSDEFAHERSSVSGTLAANEASTVASFDLVQNPVGQTIRINSPNPKPQIIDLYDTIGRKRASFNLQVGANQFAWPEGLGAGIYALRLADNASSEVIKLIHY